MAPLDPGHRGVGPAGEPGLVRELRVVAAAVVEAQMGQAGGVGPVRERRVAVGAVVAVVAVGAVVEPVVEPVVPRAGVAVPRLGRARAARAGVGPDSERPAAPAVRQPGSRSVDAGSRRGRPRPRASVASKLRVARRCGSYCGLGGAGSTRSW